MDTTFWMGIAIGAIISLFVSIMANLYTPRLRTFLDKRSELRLSNKKADELQDYALAKGVLNGLPLMIQKIETRRNLALRMMIYALAFLVMATGFLVLVTALISLRAPEDSVPSTLVFVFVNIVLFASMAAIASSVRMNRNVRDIIQKASNLEKYENDIRKKWGEDAI